MKILVIRLHDTEKIFATIPLLNAIKLKYPDAILHYVTTDEFKEYLEGFPIIEKLFFVKGDITPLVLSLLKEKYSHTIDLQGNTRSRFITSHLGQQFNAMLTKYSYPGSLWQKLFNKKYFSVPNLSSQFIKCTNDLQLSTAHLKWIFPVKSKDDLNKNDIPMSHSLGYYCIDVGGAQSEKISQLIAQLNFPVILLGASSEYEIAEQIKKTDPIKIYNSCGKYSTGEQFNILKGSRLNIIYHSFYASLSATVSVPIISTNSAETHIQELEPFCSNSGISFQKAIWLDTNDIISKVQKVILK